MATHFFFEFSPLSPWGKINIDSHMLTKHMFVQMGLASTKNHQPTNHQQGSYMADGEKFVPHLFYVYSVSRLSQKQGEVQIWGCGITWGSLKWPKSKLGGVLLKYLLFSSLFREDEPILASILFKGVGSTTNQLRIQRCSLRFSDFQWSPEGALGC